MLGAGDRMARNDARGMRDVAAEGLDREALGGADVGHNRVGPKMRRDRGRDLVIGAHRHRDDDELGRGHERGIGGCAVRQTEAYDVAGVGFRLFHHEDPAREPCALHRPDHR